jgi:hypothetical protein
MRSENDFYPTPQPVADAICARMSLELEGRHFDRIIEPSCGNGAFIRPLARLWNRPVIGVDIDPGADASAGVAIIYKGDWAYWIRHNPQHGRTLVIGNPPFSLAAEHILAGLENLATGSLVCFLLKQNFFGSEDRRSNFWTKGHCLRWFIPIVGRPSFVRGEKSSTDTNEYAVFCFEVGHTGNPEILFPHIEWKPRPIHHPELPLVAKNEGR